MLKFLAALFDLLDRAGQYFANQQLINAGKAEQQVQVQQETETHVEQATEAIAVLDAARTERLRDRFDQSYGNE